MADKILYGQPPDTKRPAPIYVASPTITKWDQRPIENGPPKQMHWGFYSHMPTNPPAETRTRAETGPAFVDRRTISGIHRSPQDLSHRKVPILY